MNKIRHLEECVMLDTVGFTVEDVNAELPMKVDVNGKRRRSIGTLNSPSGRQSFKFWHVKKHNRLHVEGSAAMHFQDHNIVASNDLRMTVIAALKTIKDKHKVHIPLEQAYGLVLGQDIAITRVDTPAMLRVPAGLQRSAVVNGLALAGFRCGLNVTLHHNETCYFDQHSQIVALKGYLKDVQMEQMRKKAKPAETENTAALLELARSTIRIEPVYRKKYFKALAHYEKTPPMLGDLSPWVLATMFASLLEKYNLRGSLRACLTDDDLWAIPHPYRGVVDFWQRGKDMLKYFGGDRRALARYRRMLKKKYSIDINEMPPGDIEVPVQIGEILRTENFVPVPDAIRRDPKLFHTFDVQDEWRDICDRRGLHRGISRAFVDLYGAKDDPEVDGLIDFPPIE
ncbi:phage/plasmid replication protein, gene II/X family [Burkholderia pseudomallei]|nr:phage/plasmid replication protein, gene II/X family [Burkholderia pseudomallei]